MASRFWRPKRGFCVGKAPDRETLDWRGASPIAHQLSQYFTDGNSDLKAGAAEAKSVYQTRRRHARSENGQAVGRESLCAAPGANDLSPAQGVDSPNRRVTFEAGYDGEAGQ